MQFLKKFQEERLKKAAAVQSLTFHNRTSSSKTNKTFCVLPDNSEVTFSYGLIDGTVQEDLEGLTSALCGHWTQFRGLAGG